MRSPTRTLAASTLVFEALVVFFAGLVAKDLSSLSTGEALGLFGGVALACLLVAGLLRRPAGYVVGSVLQVARRPANPTDASTGPHSTSGG